MILNEFRKTIASISELKFSLGNGIEVPPHFHITEIGSINKSYIDCGGTHRNEQYISFQLWFSNDVEHRLSPNRLITILDEAANKMQLTNSEIEVEYQSDTIGKYALSFESGVFVLQSKFTNCLAEDQCGITEPKKKVVLASVDSNSCAPGSGCC
ncbi:MAG: hypothetical protein HOH34_03810 [Flavobacteriales bacterium]|jgi:hypothetical protein|nr:hypothetical protein [Flavobacteriales bacterium]MDC0459326.1 DUF6428 family protein [Crocinitomicaceae bacterium]